MKTLPAAIASLLLLTASLRAHIGSPNVFFEGAAGPHTVRVVIRPPATLPGVAQVDVRVAGESATGVSVQAAPWDAGDAAAGVPVMATPVAGAAGLFNASLWLLAKGSYRVSIRIESQRGNGAVMVPLNSAATQRPAMPPALGTLLAALGAALLLGVVGIASAAARESTLAPELFPSPADHARGRRGAITAALALIAALTAGTLRWRTMDREFRNNALARPLPVEASIRSAGTLRLLHLTPGDDAAPDTGWETLAADHGKLMHLFLVREPDLAAFAHLHPVRRDGRTFENVLPPLPAGDYQLYAEVTQENGLSQTLTARIALPAPAGPALPPMADWKMVNEVWCKSPSVPLTNGSQPFALDADDSWHLGPPPAPAGTAALVSPLMGGGRMVFHNAGGLAADRETALRFTVFDAEGRRVPLQPYMGMLGHAVVRRADGSVFTHLHPAGTVSMAAQEMLANRDRPPGARVAMPIATGEEVTFPYAFPRPGDYRLWVQVRIAGRVLTGVFAIKVRPAS